VNEHTEPERTPASAPALYLSAACVKVIRLGQLVQTLLPHGHADWQGVEADIAWAEAVRAGLPPPPSAGA
jgi:hypothetical protein